MEYKLTPLYQLIVSTRTNALLPDVEEFAITLIEIQESIIAEFKRESKQAHLAAHFREFINDHYLSLVDHQEKLYNMREPYKTLIGSCVTELKEYLLENFDDILNSYQLNSSVKPLTSNRDYSSIFKSLFKINRRFS